MDLNQLYSSAEQQYRLRTTKSEQEYKLAQQYFPGGVTRNTNYYAPYPITVVRSEGAMLHDADGNPYYDYIYNYGSIIHGHAHPEIARRVRDALSSGTAVAASIPEQMELARIIRERVPSIEQLRYCNSGLEATLFAIKTARAYTGRPAIIKMEGGFHGYHDLVEHSVKPPVTTQMQNPFWKPIPNSMGISKSIAEEVYIAPFNNAEAVEAILKEKANEIAAIIVEPVLGASGTVPALPGYLAELRRLADQYDVLLILDEVLTLRIDYGGAQGHYNVVPDLTTTAKIIGGGFPVAAFGGRADVMSILDPGRSEYVIHSGTFSGNNVSMVAGIASMELYDREAVARMKALTERLIHGMKQAIARYAIPASINGVNSMLTLHFTEQPPTNYASVMASRKDLLKILHLELMNNGIFISPRGAMYLSTALTEADIDHTVTVFTSAMDKIAKVV
jgi:Glutamate-1-semialdehyde aminotransferase